jgi:hypothetical protein
MFSAGVEESASPMEAVEQDFFCLTTLMNPATKRVECFQARRAEMTAVEWHADVHKVLSCPPASHALVEG